MDSPQLTFIIWQSGLHLIKASVGLRASVSAHMCVFLQCKHMPSPICCLIAAVSFLARPASQPGFLCRSAAGWGVGGNAATLSGKKTLIQRRTHWDDLATFRKKQTQSPLHPSFLLKLSQPLFFLSFVNFTFPLSSISTFKHLCELLNRG